MVAHADLIGPLDPVSSQCQCMYIVEVCLTSMPSSSVHLALEAWTVHVVAACKAFQIAREAVQISNSTTTVTVVLYSHYHSRATLVK